MHRERILNTPALMIVDKNKEMKETQKTSRKILNQVQKLSKQFIVPTKLFIK